MVSLTLLFAALPPVCSPEVASPRIVAACGHGRAPAHPHCRLDLVKQFEGDRGRVVVPLLLTQSLPAVASLCIVAATCNDHAPTHPLYRIGLVTKYEGDHCRVFSPLLTQTLPVPGNPPNLEKMTAEPASWGRFSCGIHWVSCVRRGTKRPGYCSIARPNR
jgi:hypothetical protein